MLRIVHPHTTYTQRGAGRHHRNTVAANSQGGGKDSGGCLVTVKVASPCAWVAYVEEQMIGMSMIPTLPGVPALSSFTLPSLPAGQVTLVLKSLCPLPTGQPMVASDINVCGTAVGTGNPDWRCTEGRPMNGASSWLPAVPLGPAPVGLSSPFIGASTLPALETTCRLTLHLLKPLAVPPAPAPAPAATVNGNNSGQDCWSVKVQVKGNASLALADKTQLASNFGLLLGLPRAAAEQVRCIVLGSAKPLSESPAAAGCSVASPLFAALVELSYQFSGPQCAVTPQAITQVMQGGNFPMTFDTSTMTRPFDVCGYTFEPPTAGLIADPVAPAPAPATPSTGATEAPTSSPTTFPTGGSSSNDPQQENGSTTSDPTAAPSSPSSGAAGSSPSPSPVQPGGDGGDDISSSSTTITRTSSPTASLPGPADGDGITPPPTPALPIRPNGEEAPQPDGEEASAPPTPSPTAALTASSSTLGPEGDGDDVTEAPTAVASAVPTPSLPTDEVRQALNAFIGLAIEGDKTYAHMIHSTFIYLHQTALRQCARLNHDPDSISLGGVND